MKQGSGHKRSAIDPKASTVPAPNLLVELEPWSQVFLRNLGDLFQRQQPPLRLSSRPAPFWPDVFVRSALPWGRFLQSGIFHVVALFALWGLLAIWPHQSQIVDHPIFHKEDVISYSAAEYLPPIDTGGAHAQHRQKGEPAHAAQPIISVPRESDNRTQTIVTPPNLKLDHEVKLPNIVAWSPTQVAVPMAATSHSTANLRVPAMPSSVVAPPPEVTKTGAERSVHALQPAVIEPPPGVEMASRRESDINIGHAEAVAPAPQLPMAEQRAAQPSLGTAGGEVVPPPPSLPSTGTARGGGQLIALGIHPAAPGDPVDAPSGNRRGTFAATPEGKPGAAGTPDIQPGGSPSQNGAGSGNATSGAGSGSNSKDVPSGIFVGSGPKSGNGTGGGSGAQSGSNDSRLMADATPPRVGSVPRSSANEVPDRNATDLDKKVFGDRKFYSMTLNMPNLNSAGGSWVIRFAELQVTAAKGDLTAPVAMQKVDPAYPIDLMRRNVQGLVTLYAVIHSDGSVGEVRVLRGVDDRLDEYARAALVRWHFRPATKNGNAVDLEAVVTIPFKPGPLKSSF